MGQQSKSVRLAAVQYSPAFLDLEGSIDKSAALILEAGRSGADIVGFPEGFIPTHPLWYHFHPASSPEAQAFSKRLAENSIVVPGPDVDALCKAARNAGVFVVMGCCEREGGRLGTLYNTLLFINADGNLVGRHRKLVPTLGERLVHARGDAEGLRAYPTSVGLNVSGLMCGENSNALATYALDAQGTNVHVASWPSHFQLGANISEIVQMVTRALAYQMKAFVINAVSVINEEMLLSLPVTEQHRTYMAQQGRGSSIIGPSGEFLAGPMGNEESILYADVDPRALVSPKVVQDFAGHYNRFDLLSLSLTRTVPRSIIAAASDHDKDDTHSTASFTTDLKYTSDPHGTSDARRAVDHPESPPPPSAAASAPSSATRLPRRRAN
jgi:aliphatic nitrilase